MTAAELELAPTETDLALANGRRPRLVRYDPTAPEPEFTFEVIDGYVVRKPMGARETSIATVLHNTLSRSAEAAGVGRSFPGIGYDLPGGGPRRKPDVSFLSEARWPRARPFPEGDFVPVVPELAVEVVSPHDLSDTVFNKVEQYFRAGVSLVWIVLPRHGRVYCYSSPTAVRILSRGDDLTGDPVVPGFQMPIADLLPAAPAAPPTEEPA